MDNRKQMRIKHLSFLALRTIEECTVYRFNFINARSFEHNDGSILRTCRNYTLDHNLDSSATPAERICPTCLAKWSQIPTSSASQLHYGGRKKRFQTLQASTRSTSTGCKREIQVDLSLCMCLCASTQNTPACMAYFQRYA